MQKKIKQIIIKNSFNGIAMISILLIIMCSTVFSSENIPVDSWIYRDLLKLEACGVVKSEILNQKPYSRMQAAKIILTSRSEDLNPDLQKIIEKLEKEFSEEINKLNIPGYEKKMEFNLREIKLLYVNANDSTSVYKDTGSLYYYTEYPQKNEFKDRKSGKGNNVWVKPVISLNYPDIFWISYRPVFNLASVDEKNNFENDEYSLKLAYKKIDIVLGRENIIWGPGQHGQLLISDNAPPREMVQIRNNDSFVLPWFFSKMGEVKFHAFFTKLEDERRVPETWFSGIKLNFLPSENFEFGVEKTVMSGGEGYSNGKKYIQPTLLDLVADLIAESPRELKGENFEDPLVDTNQIAGFDFRYRVPAWNSIFYAEYAQEDYRLSPGDFVRNEWSDRGVMLGWYWAAPFNDYKNDFFIEYARTVDVWYRHGKYKDGYTYKNKIMGHHMGSDAEDIWVSLRREVTDKFKFTYSLDIENHGTFIKKIDKNYQHYVDMEYVWSDKMKTTFSYANVELEKTDQKNHLFGAGLVFSFQLMRFIINI